MTEILKTRQFEGNSEAIEAWNGVLFDAQHRRLDQARRTVHHGGVAAQGRKSSVWGPASSWIVSARAS